VLRDRFTSLDRLRELPTSLDRLRELPTSLERDRPVSWFARVPRVSSAEVRGRHSERGRVKSEEAASWARARRADELAPRSSLDRERLDSTAARRSRSLISYCRARMADDSWSRARQAVEPG
jgi:hypothetical protein